MLVRYWMTKSPKTATTEMNLEEALNLFHQYKVRRLPVVKDGEKLCGIIALSDLYPYVGPHGLNRAERSAGETAKLREIRIADVMTKSPITCNRNASLEEIGGLMRRERIGAVPVVEGDELVGIITESDVLGALADITRAGSDGRRICFRIPVEEKINIFYRIVSLCEENKLEILTLLTHPIEKNSHLVMIRVRGERVPEFVETLWRSHYEVLAATPQ
jgi:acetoin utilization protein AcuB